VLRSGWVIVGSLPTKGGNVSGPGCLIVLDRWGHVRETFAGQGINGPWDMGSLDLGSQAVLFVTNVLNGTVAAKGGTVFGGTVLRLVVQIPRSGLPWIQFNTTIGSGFAQKLDPAALVIGPTGVGLTTALTVLRSGWVIVGSLPTKGGNVSGAGCLIVLDRWGNVRETFRGGGINGPWDMGSLDLGNQAVLFVTNVLNGTVAAKGHVVFGGTVLRLVIKIPQFGLPFIWFRATIGSGFPERTDPAALVVGPTGAGLGRNDVLYVADTLGNRIAAIPNAVFRFFSAGTGFTVTRGRFLNGPLGLVIAPGGNILTVNSGNGNLVETTPFGAQIAVRQLDSSGSPPGAGALFGLAVKPGHRAVYYVDDATNTLNLLHR
ncbi:MAG TPA: hypothetical protein VJ254_03835, partial [Streptosporangiaceae bacterium]|nr:hypothetical protein [Streptosporangiaceae bacterium]